jgi:hypothetical protein
MTSPNKANIPDYSLKRKSPIFTAMLTDTGLKIWIASIILTVALTLIIYRRDKERFTWFDLTFTLAMSIIPPINLIWFIHLCVELVKKPRRGNGRAEPKNQLG